MTERDPQGDEELTPAQAEAVRRLLAGARHDEGIPDDVAARLDAVIADLAAEGVEAPARTDEPTREAEVIPFRRRRWPQVLVAAAAVTVFGFGIAQIVGNGRCRRRCRQGRNLRRPGRRARGGTPSPATTRGWAPVRPSPSLARRRAQLNGRRRLPRSSWTGRRSPSSASRACASCGLARWTVTWPR